MTDCKMIHLELIKDDHVQCPFCCVHSVEAKSIQVRSCEKPNLINDKVCQNCGTVNDLVIANEYVDLYENRHRMRKKSISHGKYNILNIIDDIAQKNNLKIGYYNRENILRIFKLIDQVHQKLIMAENGWFLLNSF